jgi:hypothetical protein
LIEGAFIVFLVSNLAYFCGFFSVDWDDFSWQLQGLSYTEVLRTARPIIELGSGTGAAQGLPRKKDINTDTCAEKNQYRLTLRQHLFGKHKASCLILGLTNLTELIESGMKNDHYR